MGFPTTKKKIRNLSDDVDLCFYKPKKVLAKYGYSQSRLAEELGISLASLNGIVNGNPSIAQIKVLSDAIGCSFYEFFEFDNSGAEDIGSDSTSIVRCPSCGKPLALTAI